MTLTIKLPKMQLDPNLGFMSTSIHQQFFYSVVFVNDINMLILDTKQDNGATKRLTDGMSWLIFTVSSLVVGGTIWHFLTSHGKAVHQYSWISYIYIIMALGIMLYYLFKGDVTQVLLNRRNQQIQFKELTILRQKWQTYAFSDIKKLEYCENDGTLGVRLLMPNQSVSWYFDSAIEREKFFNHLTSFIKK